MKIDKANELKSPRPNEDLATLHKNAAALLRKLAETKGEPLQRDLAMARIYANQLDRRKQRH